MASIMSEIQNLLIHVAEDYELDQDELINRYLVDVKGKGKATAPKRPAKVVVTVDPDAPAKCSATTAKGKPCSAKPLAGTCLCRVHTKKDEGGPSSAPAPVKAPKREPAPKKTIPTHTHELDDKTHDDCELCQTHGNPLTNPDGEEEYETVASPVRTLRDRLEYLGTEDDFDDEDDE
jgi:hypothetical protein